MCLGIPLGMLLSPSPGQLLGSYVLNRVLAIRLDQWLKGILHQREKERKKERFKQIELPAKLLDYFLWSNKSKINQSDWRNDVNTLIATGFTVTSKKKMYEVSPLSNRWDPKWSLEFKTKLWVVKGRLKFMSLFKWAVWKETCENHSSGWQNWRFDKIGDSGVKGVILKYCRCTSYYSTSHRRER